MLNSRITVNDELGLRRMKMAEMFHKSVIYTDVPSPHQPLEWHEEIKEKCCHDNMYIICHRANVGISDIITIVHKHILEGCAQSTLQIV
jgi:hypothetical protein